VKCSNCGHEATSISISKIEARIKRYESILQPENYHGMFSTEIKEYQHKLEELKDLIKEKEKPE
jgi:hypothetical protein